MSNRNVLFCIILFLSSRGYCGDIIQEFRDAGAQDVVLLGQIASELPEGVTPDKFQSTLAQTTLDVQPKLVLRGLEVDAINYPDQKKIQISEPRWEAIQNDPARMKYLVMHEVFGVMGVEIDNFFVSVKIKNMLQAQAQATLQITQDDKQAQAEVMEIMNEEISVNLSQWAIDVSKEMQSDGYKLCQKTVGFWDSNYDRDQACIAEDHLFSVLRDRVKTINASQRMLLAEGLPGSDWNLDSSEASAETSQDFTKTAHLIQLATQMEDYADSTAAETGACAAFDSNHVDPKAVDCEYQNLITLLGKAPAFWASIESQIERPKCKILI